MDNFDLATTVDKPVELLAGNPALVVGPDSVSGLVRASAAARECSIHDATALAQDSLPAEPERPIIEVTTEEFEINNAAIEALSFDTDIYQRNHMLVKVLRSGPRPDDAETGRDPGAPTIAPVHPATLRERMSKCAIWVIKVRERDEWAFLPVHPPTWSVLAVANRSHWDGIRPISGVTEVPLFLASGRILETPGYDRATGLFFAPEIAYPRVAERPSKAAAELAARALLSLVSDFPFKTPEHRAGWLSALLSIMARPAIGGPVPMHLFDSNMARTGKSLLADLISIVGCGRCAGRTVYPLDEAEMGKTLLAVALGGIRMLLFDNREVGLPVGGACLDLAITAQTVSGRILGFSRFETDIAFNAVVVCTGNNLALTADAADRVILSRLESEVERPAERDDWQIPNLPAFVRQRRGPLASAALTILKAFHCAGRPVPDPRPKSLGGFECWSNIIRNAVIWATGGADPCATRGAAKAVDTMAVLLPTLVAGWTALCKDCGSDAISTTQALKALESNPGIHKDLHTVLSESTKDGRLPSPQALGNLLGRIRGRVVAGRSLDRLELHGVNQWFVRAAH